MSLFTLLLLFLVIDGVLARVGLLVFEELAELVVSGGQETSQEWSDPV